MAANDPALEAVRQARLDLQASRTTLVRRIFERETRRAVLAEVERTGDAARIAEARSNLTTAEANYSLARQGELAAKNALRGRIAEWLGNVDAEEDLQRLSASHPIVLFPVRVETRFAVEEDPPALKVRIYPDEIFVDVHERALTPAEHAAGVEYYVGRALDDKVAERERWRRLIARFPVRRAAYIVRVMRPQFPGYGSSNGESGSGPGGGDPVFPDVPRRPDSWTRPGEALAPDRWIITVYPSGRPPRSVLSAPVREPLPLTIDPGAEPSDLETLADGLQVERELAWTVDFERAVEAGMAVRVPLEGDEGKLETLGGFDRIIVLGVKTSMPPGDTAAALERLFDSHHYTRGLGIVAQGTPSNNTAGRPVPGDPPDRTGADSFAIEREEPPTHPELSFNLPTEGDSNFNRLGQAFGMPNGVFRNTRHATELDNKLAGAMNYLLWPTTLGYFMEQLMHPVFGATAIESGRNYFVDQVRGRGNFPAFRVEEVPYGVLPVLSLARWQRRQPESAVEALEAGMLDTLRRLVVIWNRAADIPRILPTAPIVEGQPMESPLLSVLAQDASSGHVRVRNVRGALTLVQLGRLLRLDPLPVVGRMISFGDQLMAELGHPEWDPRIAHAVVDDHAEQFDLPLVSTTPNQPADYLQTLPHLTLAQLRDLPVEGQPLLYLLIRHALMIEYARIAHQVAPGHPSLTGLVRERELWNTRSGTAEATTIFQAFEAPFEGETIGAKVLRADARSRYRNFLTTIDRAPAEELERLMMETLDVCSHRLDAWLSALAARRLLAMRAAQGQELRIKGSYLGGYGLLHDVRRSRHDVLRETEVGPAELQPGSGGFIHAPSMAHARAAGVLRSGHLSHRFGDPKMFAIDLSSERARRARALLDEVRDGVPLAAALGYRFERAVHEAPPVGGVTSLEPFLRRLRQRFNLLANKTGEDPDPLNLVETVAARNVVDGRALLEAHNAGTIPWNSDAELPDVGTAAQLALVGHLDRLNELFDAVSDLLTAESMFQLAQGNIVGAQAAADALASGGRPPEPEVARSRFTGVGVTHRVALVFQGSTPPAPEGSWPDPDPDAPVDAPLRSRAEPFLDGWLGQLLGRPENVIGFVDYIEAGASHTATVSLADLGLRPLDVLALARTATERTPGSALDRRLVNHVWQTERTGFRVRYGDVPANRISFPQVLVTARAVLALLGGARPLLAADLRTPTEAATVDETTALAQATALLTGRAEPARAAADAALAALRAASTATARRAALVRAAEIAPDLFPDATVRDDIGLAQAVSVAVAELARRSQAASAVSLESAAGSVATADKAQRLLRSVFGEDFLALAGIGVPPGSAELTNSLADRQALLGAAADRPTQLLQQTARVREGLGRWRRVTLHAGVLTSDRPRLDVAQLPHVPGAAWVGGPFAGPPPPPGRISLLLLSPAGAAALDPTQPWRGLLLDDWVEVIPSAEENTGIAFHYDGPNAAAGNAVLVAVPSSAATTWSFAELQATLEETFDMIELRAVDPDTLGLGQLLPGIYLAANTEDATPSTPFEGSLANDLRVIEVP
jgi:hypothetical protein